MYKFLRNYTLITLTSVAIALFGLGLILHNALNTQLVDDAQRESRVFTRMLDEAIKENAHILSDSKSMTRKAFRESPSFDLFDKLLIEIFGVLLAVYLAGIIGLSIIKMYC